MTTPPARRKAAPKPRKAPVQTANKRRIEPQKGASPVNGVVPPIEHRFKPGNRAAVGHGRPRTMQDLKELILETLAEETGDMTRARLLVRTMLVKSPSDRTTLLEYAFGKVRYEVSVDARVETVEGYDYGSAIAALAPRPVGDSRPSRARQGDSDGAAVGKDADGGESGDGDGA